MTVDPSEPLEELLGKRRHGTILADADSQSPARGYGNDARGRPGVWDGSERLPQVPCRQVDAIEFGLSASDGVATGVRGAEQDPDCDQGAGLPSGATPEGDATAAGIAFEVRVDRGAADAQRSPSESPCRLGWLP
jgi:hypothetical protein